MSMNETPRGERLQIGFFGKRNAGKSSLINAVTGQDLAVVSPAPGTTTDPVYKSMELLPLGPVVVIDTPGLDDDGELGALRVQKAKQVMEKTNLGLLVADGLKGLSQEDRDLQKELQKRNIPHLTVMTKADLVENGKRRTDDHSIWVSSETGEGIHELKERLGALIPREPERPLTADLISPQDFVVLVTPIDSAAPKGRLILPQQQVIRDILEHGAIPIVTREHELTHTLAHLGKQPSLVITDSQAFRQVAADTPPDIPLTSFSILFARYKGNLKAAVAGVTALNRLQDGDKVLISEGCTHHRQCDDIGTVKIPCWVRQITGKEPEFVFTSGTGFPEDLSPFGLVVHCGACMLNAREMQFRAGRAKEQGIPFTNYGILIAQTQGILKRSVKMFTDIAALLE